MTTSMSSRLEPLPDHRPSRPIAGGTRIGHVHLKVADLERALPFYCGVLGFELTQRRGNQAAFVSAGGYHHQSGSTPGRAPAARRRLRAPRVSITSPLSIRRAALADALRRLMAAGIELDGASDHGVSEALYLRDYDQNGVELYWDKPRELWPVNDKGELAMTRLRLDLQNLLAEK